MILSPAAGKLLYYLLTLKLISHELYDSGLGVEEVPGVSHWLPIGPSTKSFGCLNIWLPTLLPKQLLLCPLESYLLSTVVALGS